MRSKLVAVTLLVSIWPALASATVLNWALGVQNTTANDQTFAFFLANPALVFGNVDARLSFGMAVADGARDGASVSLASGAPALVQGKLTHGFVTTTTVAATGAARTFAGEGGTAGVVILNTLPLQNFQPSPQQFNVLYSQSLFGNSGLFLAQVTLAHAFADGDDPNGGSINSASLPLLTRTTLSTTPGSPAVTFDLGANAAYAPDAGSTGPENASAEVNCDLACIFFDQTISVELSPNDLAGFVLRNEFGGSRLTGPVAWTANDASDATFDCGAIGCNELGIEIQFTLSPGDALAMVGRFDIEPSAVPEPATIALLGLGLVGIGLARRRRM